MVGDGLGVSENVEVGVGVNSNVGVMLGVWVSVGERVKLGVSVSDGVWLGDGVMVSVTVGESVTLGVVVTEGVSVTLGDVLGSAVCVIDGEADGLGCNACGDGLSLGVGETDSVIDGEAVTVKVCVSVAVADPVGDGLKVIEAVSEAVGVEVHVTFDGLQCWSK